MAPGRAAEMTRVFWRELRWAFVADVIGRDFRLESLHEHETLRLFKTQRFLILQRAHGGDALEMLVERRDAHVRHPRELDDLQRAREVSANLGHDGCDLAKAGVVASDLRNAGPDRAAQYTNQNLIHQQRPEKLRVGGLR